MKELRECCLRNLANWGAVKHLPEFHEMDEDLKAGILSRICSSTTKRTAFEILDMALQLEMSLR